jgi:hypothetical protein
MGEITINAKASYKEAFYNSGAPKILILPFGSENLYLAPSIS